MQKLSNRTCIGVLKNLKVEGLWAVIRDDKPHSGAGDIKDCQQVAPALT